MTKLPDPVGECLGRSLRTSVDRAETAPMIVWNTAAMQPSVVVVEDDRSVREMLTAVIAHEGYEVIAFADAESALADGALGDAAVLILDVGLPGLNGMELCTRLRREGHTGGVLMLTARHEVADRVGGLDAGADDYLVKPFALDELLARVRALARRSASGGTASANGASTTLGDLSIDLPTRVVRHGGDVVDLTNTEFELLHLLVANSPVVLTRDVIHQRIWGYEEELGSNALAVFVSQLRAKLERNGLPRLIHTIHSVGYVARLPN